MGGERFLTDREVSARLKVSHRTLQDYCNTGIIAYYQLGGKILYKESDIERMLAANYREAFRHGKDGIHPFRETAELRRHFLKSLFLNNQNFHCHNTVFIVDTRFCLQSKGVLRIKQWVGSFVEAFGSDWRFSRC